jgi:hypothetical protein
MSVAALLALAAGLSVTSHVHRAASADAAPAPASLVRFLCSSRSAPGPRKVPSGRLCVELPIRCRIGTGHAVKVIPARPVGRVTVKSADCVLAAPDKAGTSGP